MCSPCSRSSGRPGFQSAVPCFRYDTSTVAFRLSSPWMNHSNPRLISVGGSTMNSPDVTPSPAEAAVAVWLVRYATSPGTTRAARAHARADRLFIGRLLGAARLFDRFEIRDDLCDLLVGDLGHRKRGHLALGIANLVQHFLVCRLEWSEGRTFLGAASFWSMTPPALPVVYLL